MSPAPDDATGDTELAAPATAEAGEHGGDRLEDGARAGARQSRSVTPAVVLLAAILVALVANVIVSWFVLTSTTQLRDQYTAANGLQRCLIRAQLAENTSTDTSGAAYRAAVGSCLNR